jgi:hypothetical protein
VPVSMVLPGLRFSPVPQVPGSAYMPDCKEGCHTGPTAGSPTSLISKSTQIVATMFCAIVIDLI